MPGRGAHINFEIVNGSLVLFKNYFILLTFSLTILCHMVTLILKEVGKCSVRKENEYLRTA